MKDNESTVSYLEAQSMIEPEYAPLSEEYINAVSKVREILMKYCEPRPELSGMLATDIARKIVDAVWNDEE